MASEADTESEFNPDTLLADLEPLEDLDDAEFGLPLVENPSSLEDILAGNDEFEGCDSVRLYFSALKDLHHVITLPPSFRLHAPVIKLTHLDFPW